MRRNFWADRHSFLRIGLAIVGLSALAGCGSGNLGTVSGNVTLDGQPLPNATLIFTPTAAGGSTTAARTDTAGSYTLVHSREVDGAILGPYSVWISTKQAADESDPSSAAVPERVPNKYRTPAAALKADIKPGNNKIDFALQSK